MELKECSARTQTIIQLLKENKGNEEYTVLIRNGFIPEQITDRYNELFDENKKLYPNTNELDYITFDNWFNVHPEKIAGTQIQGLGYINPVLVKGNFNDIERVIPETRIFQKEKTKTEMENDNNKEPKKEIVKVQSEQKESETQNNEQYEIIRKRISNKENESNKEGILTVEDTIKIYSSHISEEEIKGWVYHKRRFGNPMFGWEKYFIGKKQNNVGELLFYAKEAFYLKDSYFRDVKLIPSDTLIGVKTKFKHEYDDVTYLVLKTENGELYFAPDKKVYEKKNEISVDENDLKELVLKKGLCFRDGDFIPVPFYTFGNIYEVKKSFLGKINHETKERENGEKEYIEETFGKDIASWHENLINEAIKRKGEFSFENPIKSKRPFLSIENRISNEFKIKSLNTQSGVNFEKIYKEANKKRFVLEYDFNREYTLFEAFKIWFKINVTNSMVENTTVANILDYFFESRNVILKKEFEKKIDEDREKDGIRLNARIEGERFYAEFLAECLLPNDLYLLNLEFNRRYNSVCKLDTYRIPVGFEANNSLNGSKFLLKPVQRSGIAFMAATNSGCLAYDVGFGKTACAILNMASLLKQGSIKRPLIAVPKQVYNNWIREMFGYWSDGLEKRFEKFENSKFFSGLLTGTKYKLNSWYNLGKGVKFENKLVDEYTITLVTYQGLLGIGFSSSLSDEIFDGVYSILQKGKTDSSHEKAIKKTDVYDLDIENDIENQGIKNLSYRQEEAHKEKIRSFVGIGGIGTVLDIDVCGFDYITLDEAHAFKNVFNSVPLSQGQKNVWRLNQKATPTRRAVKAFFLSMYVQKKYSGNICLLTATPFTNSPLEVFSMLSMIGYETLKQYSLQNMYDFLGMFISTEVEYAVTATNDIRLQTVVKSFKNKNLLKDILYKNFDYQNNPKLAGVKRPCKLNFPNSKVKTFLTMSNLQRIGQKKAVDMAESYSPMNRGAIGRAMSMAKNNAFSPFLVEGVDTYSDIDEFLQESPKIRYTVECIKSVKDFHEQRGQNISGQVIYSNRGISLFSEFKRALEEQCGFEKNISFGDETVDEVEIITGSGSESDAERKETIKDAFNAGYVKVIIGTATIKEGVNLQERGTVLYNLDLDWNPTDFIQLEGRIHRQGNKFKYVRIVVPMVQNTLDSFINQKLYEKIERISSVWDKDNDSNTLEEYSPVDPMEIRFALIDDEDKLLKMKMGLDIMRAEKQLTVSKEKKENISAIKKSIYDFNDKYAQIKPKIESTLNNFLSYTSLLKAHKERLEKEITIIEEDEKEKQKVSKKEGKDIGKGKGEEQKEKEKENSEIKDKRKSIKSIDNLLEKLGKGVSQLKDWQDGNMISLFDFNRSARVTKYTWDSEANHEFDFEGTSDIYNAKLIEYDSEMFMSMESYYSDMKRKERLILEPYGFTVVDDFSQITDSFTKDVEEKQFIFDNIKSEENVQKNLTSIREELKRRDSERGTVSERVEDFASYNYLLTYPFDKETADFCDLPKDESEYTGKDTDFAKIDSQASQDDKKAVKDVKKEVSNKEAEKEVKEYETNKKEVKRGRKPKEKEQDSEQEVKETIELLKRTLPLMDAKEKKEAKDLMRILKISLTL